MDELDLECRTFAKHLADCEVSDYLLDAYRRAHMEGGPFFGDRSTAEDRLLAASRRGGWRLSTADAFSRIFDPTGILRRKLVFVMALIENSPDGAHRFNLPESRGPVFGIVGIAAWGMRFAFLLAVGTLVYGSQILAGDNR